MKKYVSVILVLLAVTSCSRQPQKLVIITDIESAEFRYRPLNGNQLPFYDLSDVVSISAGKAAEITLPENETLYCTYSGSRMFKIYSRENSVDTIYLIKDSLFFGGDNKYYNRFLLTAEASDNYCRDYSINRRNHELFAVNKLSGFKDVIASRKAEDNLLLKKSKYSERFVVQQQFLTEMRYNALFLKKMITLYNSADMTEEWIVELINKDFQFDYEIFRQSEWSYIILEDYVSAKSFIIEKISPQDILKSSSKNEFLYNGFCKVLGGEILEYALACLFYDDIYQEDYSSDIPQLYKRFLSLFPDSPYIGILAEGVKRTEDIYSQDDNNSGTSMVNYETEPENFEEMVRPFAGKVVYIDLWATWCSPCLKMFAHLDSLKEKVRGLDDVVFFYISVDQDRNHEKWQKMSSYYKLHGYHYRVNEKTSGIIHSTFGDSNGMLEIPRYAIVDKNGKIAFPDAASPVDAEKVVEQLKTTLK
jgi:Thiol-disulfide isomerase and thioredoxins